MRKIKMMFVMTAAIVAMVTNAGDSTPIVIDLRNEPVTDTIAISWDALWIGSDASATVVITDNGTEVKRTTGAGEFSYTPTGVGRHELTYKTYINGVVQDEAYTKTVYAKWKYEAQDGGAILTDTTQTSGLISIPATIDGYSVTSIVGSLFTGGAGVTGVSLPGNLLFDRRSVKLSANGWKLLSEDSDGTEEYRSASIDHRASTSMSLTLVGPYDLTFSWKVSSENYDYLRWYLDGSLKETISGTGGTWQNVSVSVPVGEHTIQWTYSKDGTITAGSDCGWVRVTRSAWDVTMAGLFPGSYATLQSVSLTDSTTEIPANAFEGCSSLTAIDIPSTVTNVGASAFADCVSLTSVTIPVSVQQIGEGAFSGCSSLKLVTMPGWFDGNLPDGVFEGCPAGIRTEYNTFRSEEHTSELQSRI